MLSVQRLPISLPTLESDPRKAAESRSARPSAVETGRRGAGWACPVCFHRQTQPTQTCEICAAQDPSSVEAHALVQCLACGFRNHLGAVTCDLCTSELEPRGGGGRAASVPAAKIPYDEGWMD